jgi:hypothetical protein
VQPVHAAYVDTIVAAFLSTIGSANFTALAAAHEHSYCTTVGRTINTTIRAALWQSNDAAVDAANVSAQSNADSTTFQPALYTADFTAFPASVYAAFFTAISATLLTTIFTTKFPA